MFILQHLDALLRFSEHFFMKGNKDVDRWAAKVKQPPRLTHKKLKMLSLQVVKMIFRAMDSPFWRFKSKRFQINVFPQISFKHENNLSHWVQEICGHLLLWHLILVIYGWKYWFQYDSIVIHRHLRISTHRRSCPHKSQGYSFMLRKETTFLRVPYPECVFSHKSFKFTAPFIREL